jgi:tetratricopeptide (TPR) repeat protein
VVLENAAVPNPDTRSRRLQNVTGFALIFCLTLAAFYKSLSGKPIWDDDAHITPLALQSLHGLWRIWSEPSATQQYYPLLFSAFWVEHQIWGNSEVASFHGDLANALEEQGKIKEALYQYELALAIEPSDPRLSNNLAWTLATTKDPALRNGPKAVKFAEKAVSLTGGTDPTTTATLAAAYAEAGRFNEAVTTAEKAHSLALRINDGRQAAWILSLQALYRSGRAFHVDD